MIWIVQPDYDGSKIIPFLLKLNTCIKYLSTEGTYTCYVIMFELVIARSKVILSGRLDLE